ncbi:MAG: glutathione peroxidase [Kiloniellales bacterium]|nr:glutathione peroxidase [Kiloniellales bacterium]
MDTPIIAEEATEETQDAQSEDGGAHAFGFTSIDGKPLPLARYAGKAVLVVNTASRCGFTGQYRGLQALWEAYRDRGLVVLGVPSNDFGGQEPGTEAEIRAFCSEDFGVDFPLTAKTAVRGPEAHPFYRWARAEAGGLAAPKWNFHKYLIAPDGRLAAWFYSWTTPSAERLRRAVEAALEEAEA